MRAIGRACEIENLSLPEICQRAIEHGDEDVNATQQVRDFLLEWWMRRAG